MPGADYQQEAPESEPTSEDQAVQEAFRARIDELKGQVNAARLLKESQAFAPSIVPPQTSQLPLRWPDGTMTTCSVDPANGHVVVGAVPSQYALKTS